MVVIVVGGGCGQSEIFEVLKRCGCWMSSRDVMVVLGLDYNVVGERKKVQMKLLKLFKYDFLERKKREGVSWGNEFLYRFLG